MPKVESSERALMAELIRVSDIALSMLNSEQQFINKKIKKFEKVRKDCLDRLAVIDGWGE